MEATTVAARVRAMRMLTPSTLELVLTPDGPFAFEAGQYVELAFPPASGEGGERPFWPMALASAPHEPALTFCIRQREGSALLPYLQALAPSQEVLVRGPFGRFGYRSAGDREVGLIATGTGIAPIRSLLHSQAYQLHSPKTIMLFGAMTPDELPYEEELRALPQMLLIPVLSHADETWTGERGWVTDLLVSPEAPFAWEKTDFYLCGQPEMQAAATSALRERGVPDAAIFAA